MGSVEFAEVGTGSVEFAKMGNAPGLDVTPVKCTHPLSAINPSSGGFPQQV